MHYCLIAAAGSGSRMSRGIYANTGNTIPKQFMNIGERPIIIHTIESVLNIDRFDKIIIATDKEYIDMCKRILIDFDCYSKKVSIITGGDSRIKTFLCLMDRIEGLDQNGNTNDIVMFMDANRPFTPCYIYNTLLNLCEKEDIVVPAMPLVDGICQIEGDCITRIPNKSSLYTFQTPECFTLDSYKRIIQDKGKEWVMNYLGVAELYLAYGIRPRIVENDRLSIKITYDIDITTAEQIYKTIICNRTEK